MRSYGVGKFAGGKAESNEVPMSSYRMCIIWQTHLEDRRQIYGHWAISAIQVDKVCFVF